MKLPYLTIFRRGMLSRRVETGGKVVLKLYIHPILLDDEFSRQQICGRPQSPCIPSQVRASTVSGSQSSSVRILRIISFSPASQLGSC